MISIPKGTKIKADHVGPHGYVYHLNASDNESIGEIAIVFDLVFVILKRIFVSYLFIKEIVFLKVIEHIINCFVS